MKNLIESIRGRLAIVLIVLFAFGVVGCNRAKAQVPQPPAPLLFNIAVDPVSGSPCYTGAVGYLYTNYKNGNLWTCPLTTMVWTQVQSTGVTGVVSFNSRTGPVILSSPDVVNALGFTPVNSANIGAAAALGASGNGTTAATTTGGLTNGHCVSIDPNGNFVDSGILGCGGNTANVYINGAGTGIGPTLFIPNSTDTLSVFDNSVAGVTSFSLTAGSNQGSNNIFSVFNNSKTLLSFLSWSNGFPYSFTYAPTNQVTFGSYSIAAQADSVARLKWGLDSGIPFLGMGPGNASMDVTLERSAQNTLTVTKGGSLAGYGNFIVGNLTINGTCSGCGGGGSGVSAVTASAPLASSGGTTPNISIPVGNLTGNGTKLATSTGTLTTGHCVDIDSAGNFIDAGSACGTGGGGASLLTQILDFAPGTETSTSITFGAAATSTTPSNVTLGGTLYSFSNGVTLNITGGTGNDFIYYYLDGSGNRTMGYSNTSGNTYTCTGCENTPVSGITAFPAGTAHLYKCIVTSGAFPANACAPAGGGSDNRPLFAVTPLLAGLGTTITASSGAQQAINVSELVSNQTGTSYTFTNNNCGGEITFNNANPVAAALPQANLGNQFLNGCTIEVHNYGVGTVTITPAGSSTIGGQSTLSVTTGSGYRITANSSGSYDLGAGGGGGGGGSPSSPFTVTGSNPQITLVNSSTAGFEVLQFNGDVQKYQIGMGNSTSGNLANLFYLYDATNSQARMIMDNGSDSLWNGSSTAVPTIDAEVNNASPGMELLGNGSGTSNVLLQFQNTNAAWGGNQNIEFKTSAGNAYFGVGGPTSSGVPNIFYATLPTSGIAFEVPYSTGIFEIFHSLSVGINSVTFSATPAFDLSKGDPTITLTGNVTSSTISNLVKGARITFQICQDATGGRTFAWPSVFHGAMTIGSTASKCSVQSFESFDGTNLYAQNSGVANQ